MLKVVAYTFLVSFGMASGGLVQNVCRRALPSGAVKEFLTTGFTFSSAEKLHVGFWIGSFELGPVAADISLIAVIVVFATVAGGRHLIR